MGYLVSLVVRECIEELIAHSLTLRELRDEIPDGIRATWALSFEISF